MSVELQVLGKVIKQVQYRHHRQVDTCLAAVGTTLAQWDALRAIAHRPGACAHDLALSTFQSDQAFGTLAKRLLAQRLIERRLGQGRRLEHHLTPAGAALLVTAQPLVEAVLRGSFAALSEEERAALLSLLLRVGGEEPA